MAESKKKSAKQGEDGYWERETDAAHEACSIFPTAAAFTEAAERYFNECDRDGVLYGEAGLCLALSKHNDKGRIVTLKTLRRWYDGEKCGYLQDAVQAAYLRIQAQVEADPRYMEKGGMTSKGIFMLKQSRLGGYKDRDEKRLDANFHITFGENMDKNDFA